MASNINRRRIRFAVLISNEELDTAPLDMKRDFNAELMMTEGYIGICRIEDATLFIFRANVDTKGAAEKGKRIGFTSIGPVEDPVFLPDSQIKRPDYRRHPNYRYRRR